MGALEATKRGVRARLEPLAGWLARAGISPNVLTLLGLAGAAAAGGLLARGQIRWALVPLALGGLCDLLDGAVARASGRASPFGAALDSTVDRVSEALVLLGIFLGSPGRGGAAPALVGGLVLWALTASFLVSYVRARAEGLGMQGTGGLMDRPARMVLLGAILLVGWKAVVPGLALLGILASATALARLLDVRRQWREQARETVPLAASGEAAPRRGER
jgi:CDP-diacylglycerol--glycerol-3-phosphate 3-phosphatidyltransferase